MREGRVLTAYKNQSNSLMARMPELIERMNEVMQLQSNEFPTNLGINRLTEFKMALEKEIEEFAHIKELSDKGETEQMMIEISDWICDIIVYCLSECRRWGIPAGDVLNDIMNSQESKLVDGMPVPGDIPGKFGKGPNYQPPQPAIALTLSRWNRLKRAIDDGVNYA